VIANAYFGAGLFRFLKDLNVHNEREWFLANKQRYEDEVQEPFLRLIADLAPALKNVAGGFIADPSPNGGSMMRIYRDIRFSKDKSPYKTFVAAHFWHARVKQGAAPAYYLRLEPGASVIGGGIWQPESQALKKIRDRIVAEPEVWRRARSAHDLGATCEISGQTLKRPPAGYDAHHPFIEDLKRKDFTVSARLRDREVMSDRFTDIVLDKIRASSPFMQFLSEAIEIR
jgi:uncharacterized protein (TIGR02453 family)